jgi:hypothetical protein
VVYERPPAGFSVPDACLTIQAELLAQVPRAVRELGVETPAYCVVLVYAGGYDPSDVTIHIGSDEDRQEHLAAGDVPMVWSPADMADFTDVDMSAMHATARLLTQELTLSQEAMSRDVACAAVSDLRTLDWQAILPITDDFVVFAVDRELGDLETNLPAPAALATTTWFRNHLEDEGRWQYFEEGPGGWATRHVELRTEDGTPVTAASLSELIHHRGHGGLTEVQRYERQFGALAEGPLDGWRDDPHAERISRAEFEDVWAAARSALGGTG